MSDDDNIFVTAGRAARAAGMSPRAVRYAADCGFALLGAGQAAGCWRKYALVDVVRLAIAGRLVEAGFTMPAAVRLLAGSIDPLLSAPAAAGFDLTREGVSIALRGRRLQTEPGALVAVSVDIGAIACRTLAALARQRAARPHLPSFRHPANSEGVT